MLLQDRWNKQKQVPCWVTWGDKVQIQWIHPETNFRHFHRLRMDLPTKFTLDRRSEQSTARLFTTVRRIQAAFSPGGLDSASNISDYFTYSWDTKLPYQNILTGEPELCFNHQKLVISWEQSIIRKYGSPLGIRGASRTTQAFVRIVDWVGFHEKDEGLFAKKFAGGPHSALQR